MRRPTSFLLVLVLLTALLLAACGASPSGPTASREEPGATDSSNRDTRSQNPTQKAQNRSTAPASEAAEAAAPEMPAAEGTAPPTGPEAAPDRPRPNRDPDRQDEPYDSTYFKNYGVNPFLDTADDPLSTFAMDVDTASYGVMRRFVTDGNLPDPDSVRVEEYLNYFDYRYPRPDEGSNFAIYTEVAPSPFGGRNYEMVQIGLQARAIADEGRRPASLTFVIDVSGSMEREGRLETVKQALEVLVEQMRPDDQIGIVAYGSTAYTVLDPTSGANKRRILRAIDELTPEGSTNVEAGLDIGFAQADEVFVRGSNMILLCSDGVANNGVTDPEALVEKYQEYTEKGIKLSTFGFGMGNYNDILMEGLADAGNGFYTYIDTLDEAERVFGENLNGTLQLIARDAKIQVQFNPEVVSRYRLVGYENRDVADEDFRDDAVDAGEVGAGRSVTALYEIKRYPDATGDLATVRIRYHRPDNTRVIEEQQTIRSDDELASFDDASARFRLAVSVGEYAELLRHSRWTRGAMLDDVVGMARDAARDFEDDAEVDEYVRLLREAAELAPEE